MGSLPMAMPGSMQSQNTYQIQVQPSPIGQAGVVKKMTPQESSHISGHQNSFQQPIPGGNQMMKNYHSAGGQKAQNVNKGLYSGIAFKNNQSHLVKPQTRSFKGAGTTSLPPQSNSSY